MRGWRPKLEFRPPAFRAPAWGDAVVVGLVAAVLFGALLLAREAPQTVRGPRISLAGSALPLYALSSLGRMAVAYLLSLAFTLVYGRLAARRSAERVLLPVLDVLQSVPILSFLPVVLLSLTAVLPEMLAVELASIALLFTSQVWNLTFGWYQSLTSIPAELEEAAATFRFGGWLRFRVLELPHAAIGLVWNSMMSWAGGWFFLMAAEAFRVGQRDFRLPGLGSYLTVAAERGDLHAVGLGLLVLVAIVVALDQLAWRPLIAWSQRFKVETVAGQAQPGSWFLDALRSSRLAAWLGRRLAGALEPIDARLVRRSGRAAGRRRRLRRLAGWGLAAVAVGLAGYGCVRAAGLLLTVAAADWATIGLGLAATLGRVAAALAIAAVWTLPLGVAIGTSRRLAAVLQPVVQIAASVPATALFPVVLLALIGLPFGLNLAAVTLMLMGTQWYLLFNVIAGAAAIPEDLRHTARLMGLSAWQRWRTLYLPAVFPQAVTGAVTAAGGAWNASIVAEYIQFGGQVRSTIGIGAVITRATAGGEYGLLLAATLAMIAAVILINRLVWRPLYRLAEERFRME